VSFCLCGWAALLPRPSVGNVLHAGCTKSMTVKTTEGLARGVTNSEGNF